MVKNDPVGFRKFHVYPPCSYKWCYNPYKKSLKMQWHLFKRILACCFVYSMFICLAGPEKILKSRE